MTIVIDVGCATYGGDSSIPYLIEEFRPGTLIGFDPSSAVEDDHTYIMGGTRVHTYRKAAWLYEGTVAFTEAGTSGKVGTGPQVPCVNLIDWITCWGDSQEVVLKMDAEGSEYVLLPYLREHNADLLLKLAWVEWHCERCGRGGGGHREGCTHDYTEKQAEMEAMMRCEMHRWNR
jgi:hypothetical protein